MSKACTAVFAPTPNFKGRNLVSSGFSPEGTLIFEFAEAHCWSSLVIRANTHHYQYVTWRSKTPSTTRHLRGKQVFEIPQSTDSTEAPAIDQPHRCMWPTNSHYTAIKTNVWTVINEVLISYRWLIKESGCGWSALAIWSCWFFLLSPDSWDSQTLAHGSGRCCRHCTPHDLAQHFYSE